MIELLDARSDSLTVTWPVVSGAKSYALELCSNVAESNESDDLVFRELSSKLTQPQAKKKNLSPDQSYFFRVAPVMQDSTRGSWETHDKAFRTLPEGAESMEAPTVSIGGNHALSVKWKPFEGAKGYELQMRENKGGEGWATIAASLSGTEARKKNLASLAGYQFRVRSSTSSALAFSPPSEAVVARGLSEALRKRWFANTSTLLRNSGPGKAPFKISLEEALGGKEFILFYVSAHWCPPCRKFTPQLANWYRGARFAVEVVFLSADHDEDGFLSYFQQSHPWHAIEYDDDARENLMGVLQVQGIPRLVVIDASTGNIVENNAVGKPLVINNWRKAIKR